MSKEMAMKRMFSCFLHIHPLNRRALISVTVTGLNPQFSRTQPHNLQHFIMNSGRHTGKAQRVLRNPNWLWTQRRKSQVLRQDPACQRWTVKALRTSMMTCMCSFLELRQEATLKSPSHAADHLRPHHAHGLLPPPN